MDNQTEGEHDESAEGASPFLCRGAPVRKDRRHLPHWRLNGSFNYVTWRLHDSLPQSKLRMWHEEKRAWLREHPKPWGARSAMEYRERFPKRLEAWLDTGYGACYLRDPACANIVANAFRFFEGERIAVASFVVMPNHVHALFRLVGTWKLEQITHSLKGFTANEINKSLGRQGAVWQHEGFDHLLRNPAELDRCLAYIRSNPEVAHLKPGEYLLYEAPGYGGLNDDA